MQCVLIAYGLLLQKLYPHFVAVNTRRVSTPIHRGRSDFTFCVIRIRTVTVTRGWFFSLVQRLLKRANPQGFLIVTPIRSVSLTSAECVFLNSCPVAGGRQGPQCGSGASLHCPHTVTLAPFEFLHHCCHPPFRLAAVLSYTRGAGGVSFWFKLAVAISRN